MCSSGTGCGSCSSHPHGVARIPGVPATETRQQSTFGEGEPWSDVLRDSDASLRVLRDNPIQISDILPAISGQDAHVISFADRHLTIVEHEGNDTYLSHGDGGAVAWSTAEELDVKSPLDATDDLDSSSDDDTGSDESQQPDEGWKERQARVTQAVQSAHAPRPSSVGANPIKRSQSVVLWGQEFTDAPQDRKANLKKEESMKGETEKGDLPAQSEHRRTLQRRPTATDIVRLAIKSVHFDGMRKSEGEDMEVGTEAKDVGVDGSKETLDTRGSQFSETPNDVDHEVPHKSSKRSGRARMESQYSEFKSSLPAHFAKFTQTLANRFQRIRSSESGLTMRTSGLGPGGNTRKSVAYGVNQARSLFVRAISANYMELRNTGQDAFLTLQVGRSRESTASSLELESMLGDPEIAREFIEELEKMLIDTKATGELPPIVLHPSTFRLFGVPLFPSLPEELHDDFECSQVDVPDKMYGAAAGKKSALVGCGIVYFVCVLLLFIEALHAHCVGHTDYFCFWIFNATFSLILGVVWAYVFSRLGHKGFCGHGGQKNENSKIGMLTSGLSTDSLDGRSTLLAKVRLVAWVALLIGYQLVLAQSLGPPQPPTEDCFFNDSSVQLFSGPEARRLISTGMALLMFLLLPVRVSLRGILLATHIAPCAWVVSSLLMQKQFGLAEPAAALWATGYAIFIAARARHIAAMRQYVEMQVMKEARQWRMIDNLEVYEYTDHLKSKIERSNTFATSTVAALRKELEDPEARRALIRTHRALIKDYNALANGNVNEEEKLLADQISEIRCNFENLQNGAVRESNRQARVLQAMHQEISKTEEWSFVELIPSFKPKDVEALHQRNGCVWWTKDLTTRVEYQKLELASNRLQWYMAQAEWARIPFQKALGDAVDRFNGSRCVTDLGLIPWDIISLWNEKHPEDSMYALPFAAGEEVGGDIGMDPVMKHLYLAWGEHAGLQLGPIKSMERARQKLEEYSNEEQFPDQDGREKYILDLLRGRVVFGSPKSMALFFWYLVSGLIPGIEVVRNKNKLCVPETTSFSLQLNVRISFSGIEHTAELQLLLESFVVAQDLEHKYYELKRAMSLNSVLSPIFEEMEVENDTRRSKAKTSCRQSSVGRSKYSTFSAAATSQEFFAPPTLTMHEQNLKNGLENGLVECGEEGASGSSSFASRRQKSVRFGG